jgi:hypothetical protein
MNCRECGSEQLLAKITLSYELPLAARSGSIKIGGNSVTAFDFKQAWEKQAPLRGPVFCGSCGTEHFLDTREKEMLRLGRISSQPEKT